VPVSPVVAGSSGVAGGGVVAVPDSELIVGSVAEGSVAEGSVVEGSVVEGSGIVVVSPEGSVIVGSVVSVGSVVGDVASCRAHAEASSNAPMLKNITLRFKVHLTVSGLALERANA
jgi:hypothetical protein